jgi:hypothetical protein
VTLNRAITATVGTLVIEGSLNANHVAIAGAVSVNSGSQVSNTTFSALVTLVSNNAFSPNTSFSSLNLENGMDIVAGGLNVSISALSFVGNSGNTSGTANGDQTIFVRANANLTLDENPLSDQDRVVLIDLSASGNSFNIVSPVYLQTNDTTLTYTDSGATLVITPASE